MVLAGMIWDHTERYYVLLPEAESLIRLDYNSLNINTLWAPCI